MPHDTGLDFNMIQISGKKFGYEDSEKAFRFFESDPLRLCSIEVPSQNDILEIGCGNGQYVCLSPIARGCSLDLIVPLISGGLPRACKAIGIEVGNSVRKQ
jgi:hypothetical protein